MDIDYIVKTFLETLKGVPITLIIMIVAMVLSFLPVNAKSPINSRLSSNYK